MLNIPRHFGSCRNCDINMLILLGLSRQCGLYFSACVPREACSVRGPHSYTSSLPLYSFESRCRIIAPVEAASTLSLASPSHR
jgi:hypothetical protein